MCVTTFRNPVASCSSGGFAPRCSPNRSAPGGGKLPRCGSCAGPNAGEAPVGDMSPRWSPGCRAVAGSNLKMWTVDDVEAAARKRSSCLKVRHDIDAGRVLRRNLYSNCPSERWKTLKTVPFSEAVAIKEPEAFIARAARPVWWASKTWVARSSWPTCTRTAPVDCPGQHRIHGSLFVANTHRPLVFALVVRCRMIFRLTNV
mmetsp:Transcript_113863/g.327200  ORF Transcript_113863/g.327200 Transcript_113863/m.327200 type:complete len:202 (-) Transcript_113863:490-1095(-)